uniref:Uncharacterized protein n=1 Tax=Pararge aegeria TaxID=116150 RepID=S4P769_9NEOP
MLSLSFSSVISQRVSCSNFKMLITNKNQTTVVPSSGRKSPRSWQDVLQQIREKLVWFYYIKLPNAKNFL